MDSCFKDESLLRLAQTGTTDIPVCLAEPCGTNILVRRTHDEWKDQWTYRLGK